MQVIGVVCLSGARQNWKPSSTSDARPAQTHGTAYEMPCTTPPAKSRGSLNRTRCVYRSLFRNVFFVHIQHTLCPFCRAVAIVFNAMCVCVCVRYFFLARLARHTVPGARSKELGLADIPLARTHVNAMRRPIAARRVCVCVCVPLSSGLCSAPSCYRLRIS